MAGLEGGVLRWGGGTRGQQLAMLCRWRFRSRAGPSLPPASLAVLAAPLAHGITRHASSTRAQTLLARPYTYLLTITATGRPLRCPLAPSLQVTKAMKVSVHWSASGLPYLRFKDRWACLGLCPLEGQVTLLRFTSGPVADWLV